MVGQGFSRNDLEVADAFADVLHDKLNTAGIGVLRGPFMRRPPFWHFADSASDRDLERRLKRVGLYLSDPVRIRYHVARSEGQGYDDATGYWLRCWAAAFALPFKPAWVSRSALPCTHEVDHG